MPRKAPGASPEVLTRRALNRALLARQMLLERADRPVADAVAHLAGMQAQSPQAPYVGLWTRLDGFRPETLSGLIESRAAVRMVVMRGTLHLVTAADALALRPTVQPVLDRTLAGIAYGRAARGVDRKALVALGRKAVEEKPRTLAELRPSFSGRWPEYDPVSLSYAFHYATPLVQVPPRGLWRQGGSPRVTTADHWLGRPLGRSTAPDAMILRYLAAFGPASVADAQSWSGLAKLAPAFERLRPRLVTFRDETGRELFDLPGAPRPDPETAAPVRFLPEYDNVTLGHADRSRIIGGGPKTQPAQNVSLRSFLVDGFVAGSWKIDGKRTHATLTIEPFARLARKDAAALSREGEKLLRFAAPDAASQDIRFVDP